MYQSSIFHKKQVICRSYEFFPLAAVGVPTGGTWAPAPSWEWRATPSRGPSSAPAAGSRRFDWVSGSCVKRSEEVGLSRTIDAFGDFTIKRDVDQKKDFLDLKIRDRLVFWTRRDGEWEPKIKVLGLKSLWKVFGFQTNTHPSMRWRGPSVIIYDTRRWERIGAENEGIFDRIFR